jgi:hypothetical protein
MSPRRSDWESMLKLPYSYDGAAEFLQLLKIYVRHRFLPALQFRVYRFSHNLILNLKTLNQTQKTHIPLWNPSIPDKEEEDNAAPEVNLRV